mgnify:FL=1
MTDQDRRHFLRSAGAGGLLLVKPETAFTAQANSTVEIGIVGCGGRGNWIGPFFPEFTGARIVALADVIKANLEQTREKFHVDSSRAYYGPDAFRELANSKVDAVVIETPTYFHPEQAWAAVNAGKHVFMAKPVAVDVWGCKDVLASSAAARKKNLSYLVDFQTRAQPVFQEAARRIHRGDLGAPVFAQVYYYAGRPSKDKGTPGMDPGQRRVMNFYMDKVLGGDIIVEQNIHVIDVANWFLGGHPLKATGTGGRTDWTGTGYEGSDAWDHFLVHYDYPNHVHADFSSHQITRAFNDLCVRVFGLNGMADTHYGGMVRIAGPNAWMGAEKDNTFRDGAINNVKAFIQAIRDNKPVNNAETAVESNLTAVLGRMAAYKHGAVTWDEMMNSGERWTADLKLRW